MSNRTVAATGYGGSASFAVDDVHVPGEQHTEVVHPAGVGADYWLDRLRKACQAYHRGFGERVAAEPKEAVVASAGEIHAPC